MLIATNVPPAAKDVVAPDQQAFRAEVRSFAERLKDLERRFNLACPRLVETQKFLTARADKTDARLDGTLERLDRRFDRLERRLDQMIARDLQTLKAEIAALEAGQDSAA